MFSRVFVWWFVTLPLVGGFAIGWRVCLGGGFALLGRWLCPTEGWLCPIEAITLKGPANLVLEAWQVVISDGWQRRFDLSQVCFNSLGLPTCP